LSFLLQSIPYLINETTWTKKLKQIQEGKMNRSMKYVLLIIVVSVLFLIGCASEEEGPVLLQVTGAVSQQTGLTEKDLKDLGTMEVDYTEKSGDISTHSGVLVTDILDAAGLNADASGIVLVGDDGYEAEATLEEIQSCSDCIVAILEDGSLQAVMPGFSGKLQVKGLVEIRVK
jgi:hypothetical protein